jgi:hypothetical protein
MKILYLVHQFYPYYFSGTEKFVFNMATCMQKQGHKVAVATFAFKENLKNSERDGNVLRERYMYNGIPVVSFGYKQVSKDVYLEAMACKMPIMDLKRNSFPELSCYGKHGFNIEEANPTVLGNAFVDAFRNPERLQEMGEQSQVYCLSKFSWENTVNRILEVIESGESHA